MLTLVLAFRLVGLWIAFDGDAEGHFPHVEGRLVLVSMVTAQIKERGHERNTSLGGGDGQKEEEERRQGQMDWMNPQRHSEGSLCTGGM